MSRHNIEPSNNIDSPVRVNNRVNRIAFRPHRHSDFLIDCERKNAGQNVSPKTEETKSWPLIHCGTAWPSKLFLTEWPTTLRLSGLPPGICNRTDSTPHQNRTHTAAHSTGFLKPRSISRTGCERFSPDRSIPLPVLETPFSANGIQTETSKGGEGKFVMENSHRGRESNADEATQPESSRNKNGKHSHVRK